MDLGAAGGTGKGTARAEAAGLGTAAHHGAAHLAEDAIGGVGAAAAGAALHSAAALATAKAAISGTIGTAAGGLPVGAVVYLILPGNAFGVVEFQPAAALLLIAGAVVGRAAYGAHNNVVPLREGLFADRAIISDVVQKIISAFLIANYYIRKGRGIQIGIVSEK